MVSACRAALSIENFMKSFWASTWCSPCRNVWRPPYKQMHAAVHAGVLATRTSKNRRSRPDGRHGGRSHGPVLGGRVRRHPTRRQRCECAEPLLRRIARCAVPARAQPALQGAEADRTARGPPSTQAERAVRAWQVMRPPGCSPTAHRFEPGRPAARWQVALVGLQGPDPAEPMTQARELRRSWRRRLGLGEDSRRCVLFPHAAERRAAGAAEVRRGVGAARPGGLRRARGRYERSRGRDGFGLSARAGRRTVRRFCTFLDFHVR